MRAADTFSVCRDPQMVAMMSADKIIEIANEAVAERGRFVLVLTGGSSPIATYKLFASEPMRSRIRWEDTHVFFGDERAVPPDHAESNYGAAWEAFLKYLPLLPRNQLYRMEAEREDLDAAAKEYAGKLWQVVDYPPVVDLMLLGLGQDGHILSLYPGCPDIEKPRGAVVALVDPPMNPKRSRISMTSEVLSKARHVLLFAHGAGKADAVRRTFSSPETMQTLPARLLEFCDGQVHVFADVAATRSIDGELAAQTGAEPAAATADASGATSADAAPGESTAGGAPAGGPVGSSEAGSGGG